MKYIKYIKAFKLTLLVTIGILVAVLMPGDSVPTVEIQGIDKVIHCSMFFVQVMIFYIEYGMKNKKLPVVLYSLIGIGGFAFSTEVMQLFASKRSFDLKDFLADLIGIVLAVFLWELGKKVKVIFSHK